VNDRAFAAASCAVLAVYNNLPDRGRWYPLVNGCAAAVALVAARSSGLTAAELGLGRTRPGIAWGAAAAAPVAVAFAAAALTPATQPLLGDKRIAGLSGRRLAYQVLVRIPIGTVVWEEIAFRGVLRAALRRVLPGPAATAVSSVVFGIWHIRPTADALDINDVTTGRPVKIAAVVLGTAAAGVLLDLLRERSGSLAAPMVLHLTANCAGPLAARMSVT
jgi:membrane protease YdiL (CAAX protease family)